MKKTLSLILCLCVIVPLILAIPAMAATPAEIVDAAYALENGKALEGKQTLTGVITNVDTPYSEQYKNVSVTIVVDGKEDKPILCYRLKGDGADKLVKGDTITVTGTIKNYNGTIEFDAGCTLDKVVSGGGTVVVAPSDPKQIVDAAYALQVGESLPYEATLTGTITKINTAYDANYKNITVTIAIEGREDKPIVCFRLKGTGAEALEVGNKIEVTGSIVNYKNKDGSGTIEFNSGCTLNKVIVEVPVPSDPKEIVDAAYALGKGEFLPYEPTLTGTITKIDTPYDANYKNITVTIAIEGREDKPIVCFRLKGTGAEALEVGNKITVSGSIVNYENKDGSTTVEFNSGCKLVSVNDGSNPTAGDSILLTTAATAMVLAGAAFVTLKKKKF